MGNKSSLHLISYGADEVDEIAVDDAAPADERSRPLPVLRRDDGDGELDPDKFVPPDDERSDGDASDAWDLEEEVCPVCLEPWDLDQGSTLCVRCLRHVCAPCAGRCDRCPLCRGDYPGAAERRRLLEQHVIEGKRVAMTSLGECYLFGHDEGMAQSYARALPLLARAAELGESDALAYLGAAFMTGWGVPADEAKGVKYLRAASRLQNAEALNDLGAAAEQGRGTERDVAAARRYYLRAAARGHARAAKNATRLAAAAAEPGTPTGRSVGRVDVDDDAAPEE